MSEARGNELEQIYQHAKKENVRLTLHAQEEMTDENIVFSDVLEAVETAEIIEYYPEHRRGPCCLLNGVTQKGRPLHVVSTTAQPVLVIITVYEPKPPKWVTPTQRSEK